MSGKTLFDKIWDKHVVTTIPDGPAPVVPNCVETPLGVIFVTVLILLFDL